MGITAPSTASDDQERARREGTELWGRTKALLDELQRLQAQQPAPDPDKATKKAAKIARMAHARESRTNDLHTAMDAAIERHRPQLPMSLWKSRRSRADWLVKQMKDPPHWRTIDNYLNTLHI